MGKLLQNAGKLEHTNLEETQSAVNWRTWRHFEAITTNRPTVTVAIQIGAHYNKNYPFSQW